MEFRVRHLGFLLLFIIGIVINYLFWTNPIKYNEKDTFNLLIGIGATLYMVVGLGIIIFQIVENENTLLFKIKKREDDC